MLKSEIRPTKPAATAAASFFCSVVELIESETCGAPISAPPNVSCSIGEAAPMMPIPADTLRHSTSHRHQNCGVLCAFCRCTLLDVIMALLLDGGVQPSGRQPAGGRR